MSTVRLEFGLVLFVALTSSSISLAGEALRKGYTAGIPVQGSRGVEETTDRIMQREAEHAPSKKLFREHFRGTIEFREFEGSIEPSLDAHPGGPIPGPLIATSGQTVGLSFLAATLPETFDSFPPDTMGAAGPTQYIICVNGRIRSFNKRTGVADGVLNANTDIFFQSVMTPVPNTFTSDPRIRYDRLSRRWFVVMIDVPNGTGATPDRVMLAVSGGPIISNSTSWTFFYFQGDATEFADYPTLGIDANALYVGVNLYASRGHGSFDNTKAFVIQKSSLLGNPANLVVTAFPDLVPSGQSGGPYSPQGVDNYDPNATEGYFIAVTGSHNFIYFDKLTLRRISNPGSASPSISANIYIPITGSGGTIDIPHLGNTGGIAGYLDGLDYRLMCAHIRNGHLWTCQNVATDNTGSPSGTDTRSGVHWFDLTGIGTGQTPSVAQSGTVFQPSPSNTTDQRCYWMGSIMVSGQGHAAIGFSVAGANEHVNAGYVGRLAGDASNTMRTPALYTASTSAYNPTFNGTPIDRWGDFSYTCLDPDDDMTMWTIQQFCNANNSYGLQVAKLLAPPPATPTNCSPAAVMAGTANINLVITGGSDGDTGFFDPGPSFSNRISASISGAGITINSISYSNPTHVTLNISVASGAPSGGRSISIINPDGQAATSPKPLLTIISQPVIIQTIALTNPFVTVSWNAVSGITYRVQYRPSLGSGNWTDLPPDVTASGTSVSRSFTIGTAPQRYYRIHLVQ